MVGDFGDERLDGKRDDVLGGDLQANWSRQTYLVSRSSGSAAGGHGLRRGDQQGASQEKSKWAQGQW